MENRDRDEMGEDTSPIPSSDVNESESESNFGENIGRSEEWKDESSKDESSGWESDSGRSSGSNLGEQSDVSRSRSGRGGSGLEH